MLGVLLIDKKKLIMSVDEYVIFNKKILKLVGLYPTNFLRYFTCISSIFLIIVPQICQIYLARNNIFIVLETSSVLFTILFAVLKSFVWLRTDEAKKLIEFLLTDYWQIAKSIDANNRMQGYAKSARNVTRGYFILIINALFVFFTFEPLKSVMKKFNGNHGEMINETKSFPFPAVYPEFCYESPFYEITYGSQTLATGICGLLILAMDTLIATALFHTCGHFEILHENLTNLNDYIDQVEKEEKCKLRNIKNNLKEVTNNLNKRLASLVIHHQVIIRFSKRMEKAFNIVMFLQVSASTTVICLVGFQVTSTTSKNYRLAEYLSYLVMALFQILLFCWPGDEIMHHSLSIGDAAFSTKWYDASNYVKTGIALIIIRSQRPNCLTAGKFYKMSMESFATILNTSLSYFMLLRSIH